MKAVRAKALLLCGGQSSRMRTPKHLLSFPDGQPVYVHLFKRILAAHPGVTDIYMSVHDQSAAIGPDLVVGDHCIKMLYDNGIEGDIGPAAGLLAAYEEDRDCHWLLVACDYPLLSTRDICRLFSMYQEPLTCFINTEGWVEPLLGVWSPISMRQLCENVKNGLTGPKNVVQQLNGVRIDPLDAHSLFNANTPEEWRRAMHLFHQLAIS